MAITLEQAKALRPGMVLHHATKRNADGTPQRWMVNGQPKVWARTPTRVYVPLKHGLYTYDCLTENTISMVNLA